MPKFIEVGTDVLEFPDEMPDSEIQAVLAKEYPAEAVPAPEPTPLEKSKAARPKQLGHAAVRGGFGLPSTLAFLDEMAERYVPQAGKIPGTDLEVPLPPPAAGMTQLGGLIRKAGFPKWLQENFGERPIPEDVAGRYQTAAVEGVASALPMGGGMGKTGIDVGGKLLRAGKEFLQGGAGGLGSEAAVQAYGEENPAVRIAGAMLGSGAVAAPQAFVGTKEDLAQLALKDVDPLHLDIAKQNMRQGERYRIPVNLSQAMPEDSNIDTVVDAIANSQFGEQLTGQLRAQPTQVMNAARAVNRQMPGQVLDPQVAANVAQEAGTKAIKGVKGERSAAFRSALGKGGETQIPQPIMQQLDADLDAMAAQYPASTSSHKLIQSLRKELQNPNSADPINAPFYNSVEDVHEVLKSHFARSKDIGLKTGQNEAAAIGRLREANKHVRELLKISEPKFRTASDVYEGLSTANVNPMIKSVTGRIAGKGASELDEASRTKAYQVFDRGTVPNSGVSEILTFEKDIRKSSPEVFPDLVKSWMADKIAEGMTTKGGRTSPDIGAHLEKTFFGNKRAQQGTRDMLVGVARAQGLSDNALYPGFQKVMRHLSLTAQRPGRVRGATEGEVRETAAGWVGDAIRFFGWPFQKAGTKTSQYYTGKTFQAFDKLLTSPEGVDLLQKLAKEPVMGKASEAALNAFFASQATRIPEEEPTETEE